MSAQANGMQLEMARLLNAMAISLGRDHHDIARALRCRPHYVRRVLNGTVRASPDQLQRIARVLGYQFPVMLVPLPGKTPPSAGRTT